MNAHVRETLVTREFTLMGVVVLWCEIPRETPMSIRLKPPHQQVIVITGASSGIGLCTALLAAERGAKVVLAARGGSALEDCGMDQRNWRWGRRRADRCR